MANPQTSKTTRSLMTVAMLVCLALVLSVIESFIPLSFAIPGVKLGLANLVVLCGIYVLPFRQALCLALLKCLMTAWIFGAFSAFLFSVVGTMLSFFVMWLLVRVKVETVVVSCVGAVCHNVGQIAVAALIVGSAKVFYYLPVLIVVGAAAGLIIGLCVKAVLPYILHLKENSKDTS
ncbi:MAG: Gx transporter family protein [Coriobacteriia bacterium]|nr:Gx transporter family protein [Coriobacteriia bacterium]MCL2749926.1 Gx transporter family protein [Coriobacteriia bacterium]